MAEKIVRLRRRRRIRSFPDFGSFDILRRDFSPMRAALLVGATVLVITLGSVLFGYGSKLYSGWREKNLLSRATSLLQQENPTQAAQAAREVLELHRDSLPAFYVLAEAAEKRNIEEAVSWRAQIARLLPHDLDSQLNLASAALRFGHLDTARKALSNVGPDDRDSARFHVVAGWLALAEGNFAEQERQFAAAVKQEPGNELYQFNLAALEIRSPDAGKRESARATLERLSQAQPFRTGSLRALLNEAISRSDLAAADRFAQELQMSQQVTFADYLLCLNLYRKLDEKKFGALLEKVKPAAARNPADLALLMDWMNDNGLAAEVLKWVDKLPSKITTQPPVAVTVAEAFAEMKNWSRLKRWTRTGSWDDDDYLRLAYQSYAARQSRQVIADAESDRLWRSAEYAANGRPEREVRLARLATKWNLSIEAGQLWSSVSKNPPTRREALDALYRIYRANNEVRKLYDVLQRLHENSPNEPAITANLARLGLNIDQNTKQAQDLAKEAYDLAPDDLNCAVTYAFSLYGLGRSTEGLDIIRKLPADQLSDPHAAVYVAVLLLDENETEEAKKYVEAAQRGPLYSEERKLLEEAKGKLVGASPTPTPAPSPTGKPTPAHASPTPVPSP
jgi:predicted Zn-dependent protease